MFGPEHQAPCHSVLLVASRDLLLGAQRVAARFSFFCRPTSVCACAVRQKGPKTEAGKAVAVVLNLFMALLSFRRIDTPSLQDQGEQRRPSFFNIGRSNASPWGTRRR